MKCERSYYWSQPTLLLAPTSTWKSPFCLSFFLFPHHLTHSPRPHLTLTQPTTAPPFPAIVEQPSSPPTTSLFYHHPIPSLPCHELPLVLTITVAQSPCLRAISTFEAPWVQIFSTITVPAIHIHRCALLFHNEIAISHEYFVSWNHDSIRLSKGEKIYTTKAWFHCTNNFVGDIFFYHNKIVKGVLQNITTKSWFLCYVWGKKKLYNKIVILLYLYTTKS